MNGVFLASFGQARPQTALDMVVGGPLPTLVVLGVLVAFSFASCVTVIRKAL